MKKRILSLIMIAVMLMLTLMQTACQKDSASTFSWDFDDGVLTVSGSGTVTFDKAPWVEHTDDITEIKIKYGIDEIGEEAFKGLPMLKEVSIPSSVTDIGDDAFDDCPSLKAVNIKNTENKVDIGKNAFSESVALNWLAGNGSDDGDNDDGDETYETELPPLPELIPFPGIKEKSDYDQIKKKGKFVCGVTVYEPMNMKDEKGNWIGFDTELAKAVANKLGLEVEFVEIDWSSKYVELNSGNIDLIWNGYSLGNGTDGQSRTEFVDFTHVYLKNHQVVITKADRLDELDSTKDFNGLTAAVGPGSFGVNVAEDLTFSWYNTPGQASALSEVATGSADFAVVDYNLAEELVGYGEYANLAINDVYTVEPELYAIGARKGSDFVEVLNQAIEELSADGTLARIAERYSLTYSLIPNIGNN